MRPAGLKPAKSQTAPNAFRAGHTGLEVSIVRFLGRRGDFGMTPGENYATCAMRWRSRYTLQMLLMRVST